MKNTKATKLVIGLLAVSVSVSALAAGSAKESKSKGGKVEADKVLDPTLDAVNRALRSAGKQSYRTEQAQKSADKINQALPEGETVPAAAAENIPGGEANQIVSGLKSGNTVQIGLARKTITCNAIFPANDATAQAAGKLLAQASAKTPSSKVFGSATEKQLENASLFGDKIIEANGDMDKACFEYLKIELKRDPTKQEVIDFKNKLVECA